MESILEPEPYQHFDALLVLGRGIDEYGTLSLASEQRAVVAARVSELVLPRVVVFSGGRSWRQVAAGVDPPAEGESMRDRATQELNGKVPTGVQFLAENDSVSTAENMTNSALLLGLLPGETLAIMSDERHFAYGRVHQLGSLAFPGQPKLAFRLPDPESPSSSEIREEWIASVVTRFVMLGVRPGNHRAMMQRHRWIEALNAIRCKIPA